MLNVKCSAKNGLPPVTVEAVNSRAASPFAGQYQFAVCFCLAAHCASGSGRHDDTPDYAPGIPSVRADDHRCYALVGMIPPLTKISINLKFSRKKYKPTKYRVEGDWSSASYLLALGALAGEVEVDNLDMESLQGDRMLIHFLREMAAPVVTGSIR